MTAAGGMSAGRAVSQPLGPSRTRAPVPVNDVEAVEVPDRGRDLGGVEPCPLLGELALTLKVEEQLAAVHVVQNKVELLLCIASRTTAEPVRPVEKATSESSSAAALTRRRTGVWNE